MSKKLRFRECLEHLYPYLKRHQLKLWIGLFLVVLMQVIYAIMPSVEGQITSQLQYDIMYRDSHIQMDKIVHILGILLCIFFVKITSQFVSAFFLTDSIQKTMEDIRQSVQAKINHLPVQYFDQQETGDLLSRITNDVETLSNALQQTLSRVIGAVCTFFFVSFMMFRINLTMTLIVYLALPLIALISFGLIKRSQPLFDAQQQSLSILSSSVNELYSGFDEIMAYNQQEQAKKRFDLANDEMRKTGFRAQFASGLISPSTSLVTYITIGCVAWYGCLQVLSGTILLGELQAFIRFIWNINDPIAQLSQLSSAVQSAFSAMNRLFTFLAMDELEDISFQVYRGERVAIVGPTGAGKTTLTNLLLRFYDVKEGSIKINGIDIRQFSYHQLRDLFGLVLQDTWLFEGSIFENLKYGNPKADMSDVVKASKQANVHHYIHTLKGGYESMINESGSNISQGEKQLLTIARALLKDPQILILDEATSSVDTRLEARLQAAMEEVMKKRTSFVIAHRLSTIVNADLILVMEHGTIIETGRHEELLAKKGAYYSLYSAQFSQQ